VVADFHIGNMYCQSGAGMETGAHLGNNGYTHI